MARKQHFLNADFSEQWGKSYPMFQAAEQKAIDKVVMSLLKGESTPRSITMKPEPTMEIAWCIGSKTTRCSSLISFRTTKLGSTASGADHGE